MWRLDVPIPITIARCRLTQELLVERVERCSCASGLGLQGERWITVGDQQEGVGTYAVVPADHALDVVKQRAGVAPSEQNREPGEDGCEEHADREDDQHDVVGYR